MSDVFGSLYARGYDSLYEVKDYKAECDLLERAWADRGHAVKSVLDLGSGTGGHSLELAARGFDVTGVDRSVAMIAIAEAKKKEAGMTTASFVLSGIAELQLGRTFDAAIMMFNVIGYLADRTVLTAALNKVRAHLEPGSPFVFDFWYGPAVLEDPPIPTFKEIPIGDEYLIRSSTTHFDIEAQLCDITVDVWKVAAGKVAERTSERHQVRFFFLDELRSLLEIAGMSLSKVVSFSDPESPPSSDEWSAFGIATAL